MTAFQNFRRAVVLTFMIFMQVTPALAADGPASGEVILTLSGTSPSDGHQINATYDLAALQALPKTSFTTATMWTEGPQQFEGVLLKDLLDLQGVTTGTVQAAAINDYVIEIPVADAVVGGPIIAYALNGAPMSLRDKGPLWIVYPYDQNSDYQSEVVYSRSIWQLNRLTVGP